ncbi:hypothetical protein HKCCE3408_06235 [Rhodobacterales bacterium HKCCE3408]|nr:hypothetical protein [Rhodobacterales bacterium HKCCE3408]
MSTAQGAEMIFVSNRAEPPARRDPSDAAGRRDDHRLQVLLDRIEQMEFTLCKETGIEAETLAAIAEMGDRLAALERRLPAAGDGPVMSALGDLRGRIDALAAGEDGREALSSALAPVLEAVDRIPDRDPVGALAGRLSALEERQAEMLSTLRAMADRPPVPPDLQPVTDALAGYALMLKDAQEEAARDRAETAARIDRIETALTALAGPEASETLTERIAETVVARMPPPEAPADPTGPLLQRIEAAEARLAGELAAIAARPVPVPDMAPQREAQARFLSAMQGLAEEQRGLNAASEARFDALAGRIAPAMGDPDLPAAVADAVGDRLVPLAEGIAGLRAALTEATARPAPEPDRAAQTEAAARLMAALHSLGAEHRRGLESADGRLDRIEARLSAPVPAPGAERLQVLEDSIIARVESGLEQVFSEAHAARIAAEAAPRPPDPTVEQRGSIARLMTALDGWSKRQEEMHRTTVTHIEALLARFEADAGEPEGDNLAETLRTLLQASVFDMRRTLEASEGRLAEALEGITSDLAAMRGEDAARRGTAQLTVALGGLARANEALHAQTRARIEALAGSLDGMDADGDARDLAGAVARLRAHLDADEAGAGWQDELESRNRALRIAVAETLAEAERRSG